MRRHRAGALQARQRQQPGLHSARPVDALLAYYKGNVEYFIKAVLKQVIEQSSVEASYEGEVEYFIKAVLKQVIEQSLVEASYERLLFSFLDDREEVRGRRKRNRPRECRLGASESQTERRSSWARLPKCLLEDPSSSVGRETSAAITLESSRCC